MMENLFEKRENQSATGRRDFLKTVGFGAAGAAVISNGLFGGTANAQTRDRSAQTANLITKKNSAHGRDSSGNRTRHFFDI